MKLGFVFVFLTLGTFISVTYAAPAASSEIQQDDDSEMTDKERVELFKQITNQLKLGDEELAQTEFLKSYLSNNWRGILGQIGGILKAINRPLQRPYPSYYHSGGYESAKGQEEKELQARLNEILKDLIASKEQDEEVEDDDDEVVAQSEAIKELEDLLAAKQQDEKDREALTEDEDQHKQLAAALKADDSADLGDPYLEASQDDDDDNEDDDNEDDEVELQRLKGKRRRHNIRHRHSRRRGHQHRGGHRRYGNRRGGGRRYGGRGHSGRRQTPRGRSWLNGLKRVPWMDVLNGVGNFAGRFLGNFLNPSPAYSAPLAYPAPPANPAPPGYPSQDVYGGYESAKRQEKKELELQQIDDDYDDTDNNDVKLQAQSEALKELEDLLAAEQQDEEFNDTDDDNAQLEAQSKVLKELLKTLTVADQQDEEADETDNKDAKFQAQNESLKKDLLLALIQGFLE